MSVVEAYSSNGESLIRAGVETPYLIPQTYIDGGSNQFEVIPVTERKNAKSLRKTRD